MAADSKSEALFALHRFGFGPRPGSVAAIASDPRGALLAEIGRPGAAQLAAGHLPGSAEAARAAAEVREAARAARQARNAQNAAAQNAPKEMPPADAASSSSGAAMPGPSQTSPSASGPSTPQGGPAAAQQPPRANNPAAAALRELYRDEAKARIDAALAADIGLVERLAWFWSNHFCVSVAKNGVRAMAGAYEREAIRPHVLGRFADLLTAAETHPAMLIYLDNARSTGPNSPAGRERGRGLNENLAREILELHTLGVRTVYTQDDVTSFAKILTGWTVIPPRQEHGGAFVFNPRMHEPGAQTLIGATLDQDGFEQGRAALDMLASHPATAQHIAEKLVRHFVSDRPLPALAGKLAARFVATGGDLAEVTKTLVTAPEAWNMADRKLKRPAEWMAAAARATGATPDVTMFTQAQNLLGEPLWRPAAPKGFSDEDAAWMDGLTQRLDVANEFARRLPDTADPKETLEVALGPLATEETRTAIRRAESRPQALTLLFMAPEFQRR
jgi:uncharacterized protein (DUF1800 family)